MTAEVIAATTTEKEEVVVVVEKTIEAETEKKTEEAVAAELEKELSASASFKEETNVVSELPEAHKKALDELKALVHDALNKRELTAPPPKEEEKPVAEVSEKVEEEKVEEKEVVIKEAEAEAEEKTPPPPPVAEESDVVAEPKKTGIWGIPKVTLPWGRKSVTEAPKEDVTVTPTAVPTEAEPVTEASSVTEEIKEEVVTVPVVEETKEEVTIPEVTVPEVTEEPKEEVKEEEEGAASASSSASAVEKPKKKKIFSIPKVSLNWGFSKKEPKKEEEVTAPVTEEPKEVVTALLTEEPKEEVTAPEVTVETKEEVTVPVSEEPKEVVTVVPEVTEEPKEEVTVTAPVEEVKEEVTASAPEITAPETEAAEELKDKEVISEEPEKAVKEITAPAPEVTAPLEPEEVSIWGVTLLADEKSDVILLKFLRARDFKVKEAFAMLRNTVRWQKEFKIDTLLEEDLGTDLEKVVYINGVDKEGHPVCYNVYGEFQNKELYQSTFADVEKPEKFLRWRVQFLEKTIRKDLDFSPNGVSTFVQVNDLKASPGPFKRELRVATDQALQLLQDNYPEFVAKQVFVNVPWYYLAYYKIKSPFLTQRTKSKFVVAGPSKTTETLFKYIAPEQLPVQYGGLKLEGEQEFTTAETATEEIVKPSTKTTIEISCSEASTLVWESRVIGWDVLYGAEFVPSAEGGYTVIIQKLNKIAPVDETVLSGSYKASEAGKVVLTFDNSASSKKKKLLYRSKAKPYE